MFRRPGITLLAAGFLLGAAAPPAAAQEALSKPPDASAAPSAGKEPPPTTPGAPARGTESPPTAPATKGPFSVVLDLKGVLDATDAAEVSFVPLAWGGDLEVAEAAAPGPVRKGQVLVRFRTEKIDEQIRIAESSLLVARAAFQRQSEEAARQAEAAALALERADWEARDAEKALQTFQEVEMALRTAESALNLQWTRDRIVDQEEELRQLEKMYKGDDLVEETEEIVLMRTRRGLDRTRTGLGFQERRDGLLREIDLPRQLQNLTLNQKRTAAERDRLQATTKLSLEVARLDTEKSRLALDLQEDAFRKLSKDREAFALLAPRDGVAVPGPLVRGKWTDLDGTARDLRPGRMLRPRQTIFTVVAPGEVRVVSSVPEASLFDVKEGMAARVAPAAAPEPVLEAKVARVARVSAGPEYEVILDLPAADARMMPGQTCKVSVTTAEKEAALTVPAVAVTADGEMKFVKVWADGAPAKREVKTGATSGGRTEILSGLAEGEKVLENPK